MYCGNSEESPTCQYYFYVRITGAGDVLPGQLLRGKIIAETNGR
jgi:hypothetical protein